MKKLACVIALCALSYWGYTNVNSDYFYKYCKTSRELEKHKDRISELEEQVGNTGFELQLKRYKERCINNILSKNTPTEELQDRLSYILSIHDQELVTLMTLSIPL